MVDVSLVVNIVAVGAVLAVVTALYVHWDSASPDVQLYLEADTDHGCSSVVVRNYGEKPAYDIQVIGISDAFVQPDFKDRVKDSFLSRGIPMLAPGQQRKTIVTENRYAAAHYSNVCIQGEVVFRKKTFYGKRKIINSYALDYYSFANSLYSDTDAHEICNAMKSIDKSLRAIGNRLAGD